MKRTNKLLLGLSLISLLAGCTTLKNRTSQSGEVEKTNISKEIHQGMTQGDVEQALGDPSVIALNGANQETWIYERYAGGCEVANGAGDSGPPQVLKVLDITHHRSSSWEDLKLGDKPLSVKITFGSDSKVDSFSYEPSRH